MLLGQGGMPLRYCDRVSFPVTLVLSVTLPVDIEHRRNLSSAVVNTSSDQGCCLVPADFKVPLYVITSASTVRSNGALAASPRLLSSLPRQSTALLKHHNHKDITRNTTHDLQLLTALVASHIIHKEQRANLKSKPYPSTHLQPAPRLLCTRAATPGPSLYHILLLGHPNVTYHC
jgi:hypothetical protein